MKNYVQPGNTITLTAPYDVASGDGLLVGSIFGVATGAAANGEAIEAALVGVFDLKKVGSQAWAVGDLATQRALPYVDAAQACQDAMMSVSIVKERGLGDLDARAEAAWLAEAERSIKDATVSFAMLPIQELLDADGYIARLRARGYTVDMRE